MIRLITKMESRRASTVDSPPPFIASTDSVHDGFQPILGTDLQRLLVSSNLKSCVGLLDPLPPFIIADIFDDIAHFFNIEA